MIRILLQYVVFEVCLERFFDTLTKNFGWLNLDVKIYAVGDYIKIRVSGLNYDVILKKCIVESKEGNKMRVRCEDNPRFIWIDIEHGKITNIAGDENVIFDTFMLGHK